MTIIEAVNGIDSFKTNTYSQEDKIQWLSKLDMTVKLEIIDTHEGGDDIEFSGYTSATPVDTVMLIPAPHEDVYLRWLEAQIDYANGEFGKFNNSITMFNAAYAAFANYYNRTHMPKGQKLRALT